MGMRRCLLSALLLVCTPAQAKTIDDLYARIVSDANAGRPIVVAVHVALCDLDSQGLYVKNPKICSGDSPGSNLYWATSGGLRAVMESSPFETVIEETDVDGDLAARAVWHRRFAPAKAMKARGLSTALDVYVVGLAYRGSRIERAMRDFLRSVGHDESRDIALPGGTTLSGAAHVVGYIGHNYLMDVEDDAPVLAEADGDSGTHRGVFALSCKSDAYLRGTIDRPATHIMVLNKDYTYPGAWTVLGIVSALAAGKGHKGIHHAAATFFAEGKGKPLASVLGAFSHG